MIEAIGAPRQKFSCALPQGNLTVMAQGLDSEGTQTSTPALSPREAEIVGLAIQGHTNDGIANMLDLSVGTVNTYWLRVRLKVGGLGRTDTVARVIKERTDTEARELKESTDAEAREIKGRTESLARVIKQSADEALRAAKLDQESLVGLIVDRDLSLLEVRASLALLQLALDQIQAAVWATDKDLSIHILTNGEMPSMHGGVVWETGKTVYEIFKSTDPAYPPVAAHLDALNGKETTVMLEGEFSGMVLKALPVRDESQEIIGCIGIMRTWASRSSE